MTGQIQIGDLPFSSFNDSASVAGIVIGDLANVSLTAGTHLVGLIAQNTNFISLSERQHRRYVDHIARQVRKQLPHPVPSHIHGGLRKGFTIVNGDLNLQPL